MSEDALKRKCVKIAKEFKQTNHDDFWFYCPTDRFYSGIPDILCCFKGLWGACELKTATGKVTPLQTNTLDQLRKAGAVISVSRSAEDFRCFLNQIKLTELKGGE